MKGRVFFIISVVIFYGIIAASCEKKEQSDIYVERYISLLKLNQYDSLDLPAFQSADIPTLLKYRNDDQIITNFPHNPISSLYAPECKLGMYVLWTIESIRAVSIESEFLIMKFPSQNPILADRFANELNLVTDQEPHIIAAQAYYDWWNSNSRYDKIKNIDPLATTEYRWH